MSDITAEQARKNSNTADKSVDQINRQINRVIDAVSKDGGKEIVQQFREQLCSDSEASEVKAHLENRGFNVSISKNADNLQVFKVSW